MMNLKKSRVIALIGFSGVVLLFIGYKLVNQKQISFKIESTGISDIQDFIESSPLRHKGKGQAILNLTQRIKHERTTFKENAERVQNLTRYLKNVGDRKGNIYITRLRHGCSVLKDDLFKDQDLGKEHAAKVPNLTKYIKHGQRLYKENAEVLANLSGYIKHGQLPIKGRVVAVPDLTSYVKSGKKAVIDNAARMSNLSHNIKSDSASLKDRVAALSRLRKYFQSRTNSEVFTLYRHFAIPSDEKLSKMSNREILNLYNRYISTVQVVCSNILRVGNIEDSGWDICVDNTNKPSEKCLVYSFGLKSDFSFEESMATKYRCRVHVFNPRMNLTHDADHKMVSLHSFGLYDKDSTLTSEDEKWIMLTFGQLRKELNHSQEIIDILKIDVDGYEWKVLPEMMKTKSLIGVRQLVVEFHVTENVKNLKEFLTEANDFITRLITLHEVYEKGFRIFSTHTDMKCVLRTDKGKRTGVTRCQEVSFLRVRQNHSEEIVKRGTIIRVRICFNDVIRLLPCEEQGKPGTVPSGHRLRL